MRGSNATAAPMLLDRSKMASEYSEVRMDVKTVFVGTTSIMEVKIASIVNSSIFLELIVEDVGILDAVAFVVVVIFVVVFVFGSNPSLYNPFLVHMLSPAILGLPKSGLLDRSH